MTLGLWFMLKFMLLLSVAAWASLLWAESSLVLIFMLFIVLLLNTNLSLFTISGAWGLTSFLVGMVVVMSLLVFLFSYSVGVKSLVDYYKMFLVLNLLLIFSSLLFFMMKSFFMLYLMFELSVLPIFMIIMGWGYQSERLSASVSMFFYTLTASLPLLLNIVYLQTINGSSSLFWTVSSSLHVKSYIIASTLTLAFLVKLPMYGLHLWLPKAHVEAPVTGSMILAAVLLKLGGFGLFLVAHLNPNKPFSITYSSISLFGMILVSLICLRLTDMKMIIAYSSVTHMGFLVFAIFSFFPLNILGSQLMMISHGFSSSAMFLICYYFYKISNSRSLLVNKSIMTSKTSLCLMWFLTLGANMAAPPTLNFISELVIIMMSLKISYSLSMIMVLGVVLSSAYTLIMYSSVVQGQPWVTKSHFSANESLIPLFHVWWMLIPVLMFILLKLEDSLLANFKLA